jgi:hypothetical protein
MLYKFVLWLIKRVSSIDIKNSCVNRAECSSSPAAVTLLLFCLVIFMPGLSRKEFVNCDNWEYKLVHNLLEGYDPSIRPSVHHNATLNVTFGLALAQLIDVVRN